MDSVLVLGGGDIRSSCIFRPSEQYHDGVPSFECIETGATMMRDGGSRWLIDIPGKGVAYTESGAGDSPPEGLWTGGLAPPTLTYLRDGACISSPELIYSLGAAVASRLHDADKLSAARRPNSAATAYDAAHALAASRCGELDPAAAGSAALPPSLLLVASGSTHTKLGQVLRASKAPGAPPAAVAAFASSVERMERSRGPAALPRVPVASRQQLALSHMLLGHAHLALSPPTRAQASAAVRAFGKATAADPTSLAAAASAGRSLVLFARQHLTAPADAALSNRTVEAAVRCFSRQLRLLESLRVPIGARRSDVYSGRRPLWWADGLLSLGQAFQLLAASNEARSREAQIASLLLERRSAGAREGILAGGGVGGGVGGGGGGGGTSDYEAAARALPPRGMGPPAPGSAMLTRAARATYQRGVDLGLWQSAWQRWNVEPPPPLREEHLLDHTRSYGWVERRAAHYPHSAVAVLEAHWQTIRDEIVAWHRRLNEQGGGGAGGGGAGGGGGASGSASEEDQSPAPAKATSAFEAAAGEDDETLLHRGQWRLLRFMHPASNGWINSSVAAAPKTAAVLQRLPALRECAQRPDCYELTAQLSHLRAGSHIAPHCGRGRLSLMLPLIAPAGCCRLQVGPSNPRTLVEGEVLVFDDSWEHQAYADADRMVLIVDVPRTPLARAKPRAR